MAIKLNTGKVAFPIEFDNGDKDCIYFNPSDPDLATRLIKSKERIAERIKEMDMENVDIKADGETPLIENIENIENLSEDEIAKISGEAEMASLVVEKTKTIVCEEIDKAFGSDISSVVFKHCSPFAIVSGNYFVINFLEAITPEIKAHLKQTSADAEKRMLKYAGKYMK